MEEIKSVIFGACMLSLAVGVCNMVRPSRLFEKQVRFLISLLFVLCLSVPLLQIDYEGIAARLEHADALPEADSLTAAMEQQLLEETALCSEAAIRTLLEQNGIRCMQAQVSVHIDAAGSISISEVSVTCDDFRSASQLLRQQLGEGVKLCVEETAS